MMPRLRIERRRSPSRLATLAASILSIALALLAVGLILLIYGIDPLLTYRRIFVGAFGSVYGLSETVVKATPLMLCGVGLAVAFKARVWNIGAEGQLLIGAMAATWVALYAMPKASAMVLLPSMFIAGFMGGAAYALIPAVLQAKLKVNEVITSLMMVYVASELVNYLIYGPWRGRTVWGFPITDEFPSSAWLPQLPGTRIHHPTLILALLGAVSTYFMLGRTTLGYEIRVVGENPDAAKYAGMSYFKTALTVMIISGGLAGLAGVGEVAGIHHRLRYPRGISPGYGFTAIIAAWLGRLNPLAIAFTSLLFGGLLVGGDIIQVALGLPVAVVDIFNGVMLLFILGGEAITGYKITLELRRK